MTHIVQASGMFCVLVLGLCTAARASSITINSTCVVGSCSNADVLAVGKSENMPFNFTYMFANSDRYLLTGLLSVSNANGFSLQISNFVTTYQGNDSGTVSGNDVLQADFLQNLANRASFATTAYEGVEGTFGPGLGSASSASATSFIGGRQLPFLGPYFASAGPDFSGSATQTITVLAGTPQLDYRYTLTFGAGSQTGSYIGINPMPTSVTPEPSSMVLLATGLAGVLMARHKQRRQLPGTAWA